MVRDESAALRAFHHKRLHLFRILRRDGALTRVYPDDQDRYVLVPHSTREALYEVSPTLATLEPYLEEEMMYNNYGSVPDKEFNSGGIHWALREAADKAGYYETAETARAFWQAVADEINQACDDGLIPCEGRHSGVMSPVRLRYVPATFEKFLQTLKMLVLFEQTEPVQVLSIATPEQSAEWESYLHCTSTKAAKAGTSEPYFSPMQELAYLCLNILTWIARHPRLADDGADGRLDRPVRSAVHPRRTRRFSPAGSCRMHPRCGILPDGTSPHRRRLVYFCRFVLHPAVSDVPAAGLSASRLFPRVRLCKVLRAAPRRLNCFQQKAARRVKTEVTPKS